MLALNQTVVVDTSEQKGLIFPRTLLWYNRFGSKNLLRIHTVDQQLETGDYTLLGYEALLTADTKRSMGELHGNLLGADWGRFRCVLDRMRTYKAAAIVLQFPQGDAHRATKYVPRPEQVIDRLYQECFSRNIEVWWSYHLTSLFTGTMVLRWLLNRAYLLGPDGTPKGAAKRVLSYRRRTK